MPKISKPLSDKEIRALKPKDKVYRKSDGGNLFITINPAGRKYFEVEYKSPLINKIRRFTIGEYPTVSLKEAREKRDNIKKQLLQDIDPLIESKTKIFQDVANEWWVVKKSRITPEYFKRQCRYVEMYIYPFFKDKEIDKVTINDVMRAMESLQKRGVYETQKRTFLMTREIFAFAFQRGYVASNIMSSIDYSKNFILPNKKNYSTLTSVKDIKGLLLSIQEYQGGFLVKYALLLSIYTAQRPFNIRSAEWDEFDLEKALWTIPAQKMKMREKHIVPLSSQTIRIVKELKSFGVRGKYLFPSARSDGRQMSDNAINSALRRMGYTKDEIVAHGFRAMFSTICNEHRDEHGLTYDIIELCLAHKERNTIRSAYNHALNLKERTKLMQWWSDFLDRIKNSF
ncbi:MAG: tyrosine-type recombinase/integrase [Campylobacteraceae bacterium]|jgi:integrase|nr:tyrosine-type recombinase/integrase [Campylobacteraceae bacterium]